jgi:flagellar basal body rod protein FlgB
VSLDEELMKVSETVMEYNLSTTLYNKHLSMIRQALGRQR